MESVSDKINGKLKVVLTDIKEGMASRLAEYIGVKDKDLPSVRIADTRVDLKKYNMEGDINEKNISYLNKCRVAAKHAAAKLGWYLIDCSDGENPRSIESISSEIYEIIENLIDF